jgi:AAT family amino acid transporter
MYIAWFFKQRTARSTRTAGLSDSASTPLLSPSLSEPEGRYHDLVDIQTIDLSRDEYIEQDVTGKVDEDDDRDKRERGSAKYLWKMYYWLV